MLLWNLEQVFPSKKLIIRISDIREVSCHDCVPCRPDLLPRHAYSRARNFQISCLFAKDDCCLQIELSDMRLWSKWGHSSRCHLLFSFYWLLLVMFVRERRRGRDSREIPVGRNEHYLCFSFFLFIKLKKRRQSSSVLAQIGYLIRGVVFPFNLRQLYWKRRNRSRSSLNIETYWSC